MLQIIATGLLGLAAGMLVNYLSDILPIHRRLTPPICVNCGDRQNPYNYFLWPRSCPNCKKRRSARIWIVEIAFAVLFVWLHTSESATSFLPFWLSAIVWVFFGVVAVIDIELKLILNPVSLAGVVLGIGVGWYLHGPMSTFMGGLAGYGVMLFFFWLGALFTRLTRRLQGDDEEVALGFGDVNLAGVLGLMVGWPNILINLVLSIMIAGFVSLFIVVISLIFRRYRAFMAIPYGPFLLTGTILLLFVADLAQQMIKIISPLFWIATR